MQEVESKFEKFGPVREARIVRNPVNGESRGFGFVAMKYEEDVDAVTCTPCQSKPLKPCWQI
jgi:RNA recognition motif-containing protein